jgi:hydrogenase maturation factor
MNLVYGEILELLPEGELLMGKVRVGRALKTVALDLLKDPIPGDTVLMCEGVALGKVERSTPTEAVYVPGHTR